ncbi:hypothetical protein [Tateyamaria sp.]|uniref:hypothetical protein n=1 Tax=Tateyamaria sp. TaxID=1929288 RepID=UPI003B22465E
MRMIGMSERILITAKAFVVVAAGVIAGPGQAHDGPHGPHMLAEVQSAIAQGAEVAVELTLTNLGGPLVLTGLSANGAGAVAFAPIYLDFAQDVVVSKVLTFGKTPPDHFVLNLRFGVVGDASIPVVTTRGQDK